MLEVAHLCIDLLAVTTGSFASLANADRTQINARYAMPERGKNARSATADGGHRPHRDKGMKY